MSAQQILSEWPHELRTIYILSIRPARCAAMLARLGPLAEYVTSVIGVDGAKLNPAFLKSKQYYAPEKHLELTRGQLGCWLAHSEAWRRLLLSDSDYALILEDDADLVPTLALIREINIALQEVPRDFSVFMLGRTAAVATVRRRISPRVVEVGRTWGLFAYAVSRVGAAALMRNAFPIREAVDTWLSTTDQVTGRYAMDPIPFSVVSVVSDTVNIK